MTTQLIIFMAHIVPFSLLWIAIVTEIIPIYDYVPEFLHHFLNYAPVYSVVALGVYALFSVVRGVITFNDCDDAKRELIEEIKEAREDLRRRKVIE